MLNLPTNEPATPNDPDYFISTSFTCYDDHHYSVVCPVCNRIHMIPMGEYIGVYCYSCNHTLIDYNRLKTLFS